MEIMHGTFADVPPLSVHLAAVSYNFDGNGANSLVWGWTGVNMVWGGSKHVVLPPTVAIDRFWSAVPRSAYEGPSPDTTIRLVEKFVQCT